MNAFSSVVSVPKTHALNHSPNSNNQKIEKRYVFLFRLIIFPNQVCAQLKLSSNCRHFDAQFTFNYDQEPTNAWIWALNYKSESIFFWLAI